MTRGEYYGNLMTLIGHIKSLGKTGESHCQEFEKVKVDHLHWNKLKKIKCYLNKLKNECARNIHKWLFLLTWRESLSKMPNPAFIVENIN
jgi:hypothetical protein